MTEHYSTHFRSRDMVEDYGRRYRGGTYDAVLGDIERRQLRGVLRRLARSRAEVRWLDYATGTGRVVGYAADLASRVVAVDVSEEMVRTASAGTHPTPVEWLVADLLDRPEVLAGRRFDLVTSFRLFLNLEPHLRAPMMRELVRLVGPDGRLAINTHGNPLSVKGLASVLRTLSGSVVGRGSLGGSLLSVAELGRLGRREGMEIEAVHGCGVLSARVAGAVGPRLAGRLENALSRMPGVSRLGLNQLVVLRPQRGHRGSGQGSGQGSVGDQRSVG